MGHNYLGHNYIRRFHRSRRAADILASKDGLLTCIVMAYTVVAYTVVASKDGLLTNVNDTKLDDDADLRRCHGYRGHNYLGHNHRAVTIEAITI